MIESFLARDYKLSENRVYLHLSVLTLTQKKTKKSLPTPKNDPKKGQKVDPGINGNHPKWQSGTS